MIIRINPQNFPRRVSKTGPFVVFFDAKIIGKNKQLVKIIHYIGEKLKNISFFELEWNEFKRFRGINTDNEMNNIYLYYKGKIEIKEVNPDSQKLLKFLDKIVKIYNNEIDKKIVEIEKKVNKIENYIQSVTKNYKLILKKHCYYNYELTRLNKHKLKISHKDVNIINESMPDNWFYDVNISNEVPSNFINENNQPGNSKNMNFLIENNYMVENTSQKTLCTNEFFKKSENTNELWTSPSIIQNSQNNLCDTTYQKKHTPILILNSKTLQSPISKLNFLKQPIINKIKLPKLGNEFDLNDDVKNPNMNINDYQKLSNKINLNKNNSEKKIIQYTNRRKVSLKNFISLSKNNINIIPRITSFHTKHQHQKK